MKARFFVEFLLTALVMKIAGEFVHEVMGHGLFVLLFGGRIIQVYISILWPYDLSYIRWSGDFESWQTIWIEGGGILICVIVSIILQALLLLNVTKDSRWMIPLFWLAFWTFLNPAGYLIVGGISPFGDIAALIAKGVLTRTSSIILGLAVFLGSFITISKSLCNVLRGADIIKKSRGLRLSLCLFWLIIPSVTFAYCFKTSRLFHCIGTAGALSFLPALVAFISAMLFIQSPDELK